MKYRALAHQPVPRRKKSLRAVLGLSVCALTVLVVLFISSFSPASDNSTLYSENDSGGRPAPVADAFTQSNRAPLVGIGSLTLSNIRSGGSGFSGFRRGSSSSSSTFSFLHGARETSDLQDFVPYATERQYDLVEGVHYDATFRLADVKSYDNEYRIVDNSPFRYMLPPDQLPLPYKIVTYKPRIHYFPSFISAEESKGIIDIAKTSLRRSEVAVHRGSNASSTQEIRTSYQTWFPHTHPVIKPVAHRICQIMNMDCAIAEQLMVLRYKKGQRYVHHVDYFDPQWYGAQTTNRVATFFVYLTGEGGAANGGATVFPRANGEPQPTDPTRCDVGLRVYPVAGSAVVFYDMHPDGSVDENSLHGGCPPLNDETEKWAAVIWLRINVPPERQAMPGHRLPGERPW
eukprot:TRINITY_DN35538_c0_g1_i1.p1 TRINITY_DN35538_c0_g1~~TRINITY_DN35538_c0_g1_i1.p1  ORF type:complete len:402 (+),score=58.94 TRINITY_DN35538_c0_g1_i1:85-1290(+)